MDKSTETLARYAVDLKYENIPAEVLHDAKRKLIDTLGCAMGAHNAELCHATRALARGTVGNPPARLLGTQQATTPQLAAFVNGTMVRALDFNDAYLSKASCHPSDAMSGVLATADATGATGRALLTATVLSYEVSCNFADVLAREQGIDNPFYCLVGGALASAKLMDLDFAQMANTVAFAVLPNLTLEETRAGELSMWKGCAGANAARNAVFAAEAARAGLTGPEQPIEGKWGLWNMIGVKFAWAPFGGKGGDWRITQTHLKAYPAVAHAQSPITAALQLYGKVKVEDIAAITIDSYWVAKRFDDPNSPLWHPTTSETADHSIPYMVAAALIDGDVTAATFSAERLRDAKIHALMKTMSVREDPAYTAAYPAEWPCRIEIKMKSGEVKTTETRYFKGHNKSPMSDAEIEAKFRRLTSGLLTDAQITEILAKLWQLEAVGDIRDVLKLFAVKGAVS